MITCANIQGGAYDIITGFIISGAGKLNVVVRGLVVDVGIDPYLAIQPLGNAEVIAQNNNWQDDLQAKHIPAYLQPLKLSDAALLLSLEAGPYTGILSSVGKKGLALIEVVAIDLMLNC